MLLPVEAQPLLAVLLPHFTQPTSARFVVLTAAAILTTVRRPVVRMAAAVGALAPGHAASYRRVLSAARWSGLAVGCALTRYLLTHLVPAGPVYLVGDDTVDGHPGRRVYGKGRHRDPVRSSHAYTAWRYGHRWVVIAVLVRVPLAVRPWALPVLVDLYRTPEVSRAEGVRHRTPAQLACRLLRLMLLRFPDRTFVFVGDSSYGTHEVARFCHRHRDRLTLVSKCHPDANLFQLPPVYAGNGRPRVKGGRLPKPRQAVAGLCPTSRSRLTVAWYGGGTRRVAVVTGTGHWYKGGSGLVPLRWVFVEDRSGTHRDEYFLTTDVTLSPTQVIAAYSGRWNLETTFQECRSCLGLETTRGWCRPTVLRAAPCPSACTPSSPSCSTPSPRGSEPEPCGGRARRPSPSPTPSPPSVGASGMTAFSHRPERTRPSQNFLPTCGNSYYQLSPRPREPHKSSSELRMTPSYPERNAIKLAQSWLVSFADVRRRFLSEAGEKPVPTPTDMVNK